VKPTIFVAFRRTLPDGATVLVSVEQEAETKTHHGMLQVERRQDEARRLGHPPPVVAESRAATQQEALALLMSVAEDDAEVARRMAEWEAMREGMRRTTPPHSRDAV
jgi:hypothetical protein